MKHDYELLSAIYGHVEALHWFPLMRSLGVDGSIRVEQWIFAYARRGLAFGTDRRTVERLRQLVKDGFLAASGATQGRTLKLTPMGVSTAMAAQGLHTGHALDLLKEIISLQSKSDVPNVYDRDQKLVMAWHLIPQAGEWLEKANRTDKTWQKYKDALSRLSVNLNPLLSLGYVQLLHDGQGRVWAVYPTQAGLEAIDCWPEHPEGFEGWEPGHTECDRCFQSYEAGFDEALSKYGAAPSPKDFHNIVPRLLPQSMWY